MKTRKVIFVFDLDGTLAHTAPSLLKAGNHLLDEIGRKPINVSKYSTFIGRGTKKQVELLLNYTGGIPEKGLDFYYEKFMEVYRRDPVSDSFLYPGVIDFLEFLKLKKIKIALCTQKNAETATLLLEKLKIYDYFQGYAFGDSTVFLKPDIRVFRYAVKDLGQAKYFYVGDSSVDLSLAVKARTSFIFHKNGYSADLSLRKEVTHSFDTYYELKEYFFEHFEQ